MTLFDLARRGLAFYWRTYAAVALGVGGAVAVLAGALLVGASVRESLADMASARLGRTEAIVSAERPFDATLCERLATRLAGNAFSERANASEPARTERGAGVPASERVGGSAGAKPPGLFTCSPLLALQATVEHERSGRRAANVQLFGVDRRFFQFHGRQGEPPAGGDVLVSHDLQEELRAVDGDTLLLRVAPLRAIPLDSLHARKDEGTKTLRAELRGVLGPEAMGDFSPAPTQGPVRTLFVPLDRVQRDFDQPSGANLLLLGGQVDRAAVERSLQSAIDAGDLGLRVRTTAEGFLVVESSSGMLPDAVAESIVTTASRSSLGVTEVFTWLANRMTVGDRIVPYSLVTAIGPAAAGDAALAKFLAASNVVPDAQGPSPKPQASSPKPQAPSLVLTEWAARDLQASVGQPLDLEYYEWTEEGRLVTRSHRFRVAGVVPMAGLAIDRRLAPDYPGITDADTLVDWDPPFPINLRLIRPRDEEYWRQFRTAPKAFVPLAVGQQLWQTRHGKVTSIRLRPPDGAALDAIAARLPGDIVRGVDPVRAGFTVVDVRRQNLAAAAGATDFATYFLSFSSFLMVSSLVLTGLFFRLGIEQRLAQIGLLRAVGQPLFRIRRLFVIEGLLVALAGTLLGIGLAVAWAAVMMFGLRTWWVDAVGTTLLQLHVTPAALAAGAGGAMLVSVAALAATVWRLGRSSPRELLTGARELELSGASRLVSRLAWGAFALALALSALTAFGVVAPAAGFFGAGVALLAGGLAAMRRWLARPRANVLADRPLALLRLAMRNASWRPGRSLTAAGLLASAVFLIVSVDSFRQQEPSPGVPTSGTGGFSLVAEASAPFVHDPSTPDGRELLGLSSAGQGVALDDATYFPLRLRPGDDASCLNLFQPKRPRIVGIPNRLIDAARFSFSKSVAVTPEDRNNPWRLLRGPVEEGAVPAIADATSLQYVLHARVGDVIEIDADTARPARLRIVAALAHSMLQSELLVSESAFLRLFPDIPGYRLLLIGVPAAQLPRLGEFTAALEAGMEPFGVDVQEATGRLAAYQRVENTYLSTFQALGGLGLLFGSLGLAAVGARNILERRRELALLGATGYTASRLHVLVLGEHLAILAAGLAIGVAAALVAVAPIWTARATALHPMPFVWIAAVAAVGLLVVIWTTRAVRRLPLVQSLRQM